MPDRTARHAARPVSYPPSPPTLCPSDSRATRSPRCTKIAPRPGRLKWKKLDGQSLIQRPWAGCCPSNALRHSAATFVPGNPARIWLWRNPNVRPAFLLREGGLPNACFDIRMVLPGRIELTTSPFIPLPLSRPFRFAGWTIPSP